MLYVSYDVFHLSCTGNYSIVEGVNAIVEGVSPV